MVEMMGRLAADAQVPTDHLKSKRQCVLQQPSEDPTTTEKQQRRLGQKKSKQTYWQPDLIH